MKIARILVDKTVKLAVVEGEVVIDISMRLNDAGNDMIGLIAHWDRLRSRIEALCGFNDYHIRDVEFLAPIPRPGKIWGIGLNYADHIEESGVAGPEFQSWFAMAQTTVAAPFQGIQLPAASSALDYEAELVAIVGKGGRGISPEQAADAIFGYCVGNDVSVRDWQLRTGQYSIGKSFDTHAPYGPWIVTSDEVDVRDLPIRSFVNGEKRQESNTGYLIFDPAAQVAHLSQAMTLESGDVLFTGTPGGIGAAMNPPHFLKVGDRVRVEIDGIGYIENEVVAQPASQ